MADGIQTAAGALLATSEVNTLNGVTVTTRHIERVGLAFLLGGQAASDLGRGQQTKALSLPVALAADDQIFTRLPAALGPGGGFKVEASAATFTDPFNATAGAIYQKLLKAGAAVVAELEFYKATAGAYYVRLYNKATTPTNADTPLRRYKVTDTVPVQIQYEPGVDFPLGLGIRITLNPGDADATVMPTTGDAFGSTGYL